jgi:hypothetical protein
MVRTFLKVYMEIGSYFLFLQEQIKDIIIILFLQEMGSNTVIWQPAAVVVAIIRGSCVREWLLV